MNHQLDQTNDDGKEEKENIQDTLVDEDSKLDDDDGPPSFENVLEYLGVAGKFPLIQVSLATSTITFCTFMTLSIVFTGYIPYHECRRINETQLINRYFSEINESEPSVSAHVSYDQCDVSVILTYNQSIKPREENGQAKTKVHTLSCPNGRDFFDAKDTSYTSEWDLVCESKGQAEFTQTLFTVGQIIGGLISSPLTDYFGRKPVLVTSSCLCFLIEIAHILSPSIYVVYVVKVFSGLFYLAVSMGAHIYSVEFMVARHRQTYQGFIGSVWVFSVLLVGGAAYFVRDMSWRYFHGIGMIFGLVAFLNPFLLKESPRWLAANGKYEKVLDIIIFACKKNGKDFEIAKKKFNAFVSYKYSQGHQMDASLVSPNSGTVVNNEIDEKGTTTTHKTSSFAMLRHKRLLMLLAAGWYLWFTNILIFYGIIMTSSVLTGNRFLNFILMDLVEIPSLVLILYMMNRIGRRIVFIIFVGLAAVCLMVSTFMSTLGDGLPGSGITSTAMFILGKFSISGSFSILYVMTPELFPTNVRSTSLGYCSALGRLGNMIAPYMNMFHSEVKWGPALLFTVMCCLAVVVTTFFPETKDKDLPSTLEDVTNQGNADIVKTRNGKKRKVDYIETHLC